MGFKWSVAEKKQTFLLGVLGLCQICAFWLYNVLICRGRWQRVSKGKYLLLLCLVFLFLDSRQGLS